MSVKIKILHVNFRNLISEIILLKGLAVNDKNNDKKSLITIRPLRDLSAKEISYYALFNKLEDFVHSNFLTAVCKR